MSRGICAAVNEDIALGISLAGVSDTFIHGKETETGELKRWYKEKISADTGIMILSQEVGEVLARELFERRVTGELLPVTVIIPGEGEDRRAADLIKRAIGMDPNKENNDK